MNTTEHSLQILHNNLANVIPFTYLCPRLLSSAFVRFWLFALPGYLFHGFHLLNNPLPLRQRKGFFFPPKHSHEKFFRKFFQITPRRLFADFLARICDEGNGCLPLAIGGGYPFCRLVGLLSLRFFAFLSFLTCSGSFPCCVPFVLVGFRSLLTPSGALRQLRQPRQLREHRGGWSCCVPLFVGWCCWVDGSPAFGPASVLSGARGPEDLRT